MIAVLPGPIARADETGLYKAQLAKEKQTGECILYSVIIRQAFSLTVLGLLWAWYLCGLSRVLTQRLVTSGRPEICAGCHV